MRHQLKQVNGKNDDMFLFRRQNLESNCQNHYEERGCRIGALNISNAKKDTIKRKQATNQEKRSKIAKDERIFQSKKGK